MVWDETRRRSRVIDGQGWAPALADRSTFESLGLDLVPGTGLLGAAVPGAVPAWLTLLAEYGTMGIDEVFEPAIRYAASGCPAPTRLVQALHAVRELFRSPLAVVGGHVDPRWADPATRRAVPPASTRRDLSPIGERSM